MELMSRVHHHSDAKSLKVVLKTGEELREPILPVPDLQEWPEVVEKFRQCTREKLTELQRVKVIDAVASLEKLSSVRALTEGLRIGSG
jgi:hypothetical protein